METIEQIESAIANPSDGLPEEVFLFISRITPMINVDLLIKDDSDRTLLTWREDQYYGSGWHIPGGIIRFKESCADRLQAVAKRELGATIKFKSHPIAINEIIHPSRRTRGHFISLLFMCTLTSKPKDELQYRSGHPLPGQWAWHETCPERLIKIHEIYREYM